METIKQLQLLNLKWPTGTYKKIGPAALIEAACNMKLSATWHVKAPNKVILVGYFHAASLHLICYKK